MGGKKYMLSPLTRGDYKTFLAWVKTTHIELAKEAAEGMSEDIAFKLLDNARVEAGAFTWTHRHTLKQMVDLEGSIYLLWMGFYHLHPELSQEEVCKYVSDPKVQKRAMEAFDALEGLQTEGKKKSGSKAQRRKKVRKKVKTVKRRKASK